MKITLTRKQASTFIAKVSAALYSNRNNPEAFKKSVASELRVLGEGIETHECPGEAHSNPNIDNCMICAPYWGAVVPEIKIK